MAGKATLFLLSMLFGIIIHAHSLSLSQKQRSENSPLSTANTQDNINLNFINFNLTSVIRKKRENSELDNVNDPFSDIGTYNDNMCRRHPFRIKFSDVGLGDWILPAESESESVDIGVCKGSCTIKYAPVVSHNAKLRRLAYKFNLTSEKEAPCCAPLILGPLKIKLRYDNGTVLPSSLSDVIVSQCGCH